MPINIVIAPAIWSGESFFIIIDTIPHITQIMQQSVMNGYNIIYASLEEEVPEGC